MTAVVVALAVAVLLLAVLVAGLLRSQAEVLRALQQLGTGLERDRVGSPVKVTGESPGGKPVTLSLTSGRDTLLAFLSSGSPTCASFWEAFADESLAVPGSARLVVVTRSLDEEGTGELAARAPRHLTVVASSSAWEGFGVPASPYFVLLDGGGRVVGEGSTASWPAVAALLGRARAAHAPGGTRPDGRPPGTPVA